MDLLTGKCHGFENQSKTTHASPAKKIGSNTTIEAWPGRCKDASWLKFRQAPMSLADQIWPADVGKNFVRPLYKNVETHRWFINETHISSTRSILCFFARFWLQTTFSHQQVSKPSGLWHARVAK